MLSTGDSAASALPMPRAEGEDHEDADREEGESLTQDSKAIAATMPSWCSLASMWRVPNRMAKIAMPMAVRNAASARMLGGGPVSVAVMSAVGGVVDEHRERCRHRLQLQRDVRHRADHRDRP